jgi:hypothetical protein
MPPPGHRGPPQERRRIAWDLLPAERRPLAEDSYNPRTTPPPPVPGAPCTPSGAPRYGSGACWSAAGPAACRSLRARVQGLQKGRGPHPPLECEPLETWEPIRADSLVELGFSGPLLEALTHTGPPMWRGSQN